MGVKSRPVAAAADAGRTAAITPGLALEWVLAGSAFVLVSYMALSAFLGAQVEATVAIGKVVNVTGGGGLAVKLVVQTETGFYPLKASVVIERDTPLFLEKRKNGDVYVCGPDRGCVSTSQAAWALPRRSAAK